MHLGGYWDFEIRVKPALYLSHYATVTEMRFVDGRVYSVRVPSAGTDAGDACRGCCLDSVPGTVATLASASAVVSRWQYSATGSTTAGLHQSRCSTYRDRQTGKLHNPCISETDYTFWVQLLISDSTSIYSPLFSLYLLIITSTEEVMYLLLFVCLLARLCKNYFTDFHKIHTVHGPQ